MSSTDNGTMSSPDLPPTTPSTLTTSNGNGKHIDSLPTHLDDNRSDQPAVIVKSPDDARDVTPEVVKAAKRRIVKNMIVISIAFLFNFNAFQGLSRLQSSLHRVEGMGVISSSVIYASLMVSCMFAPKILINYIGHKWTITISFSGYILWMAANGYAVWGTLITGSILVGLFAAPLWTAQCSYFTIASQNYAKLSGEKHEACVSRFFGIFFMVFQLSSITGSIISATVLRPVGDPGSTAIPGVEDLCGHLDCPWNNVTSDNLKPVDSTTLWTMVGIYLGIACMAVVIVAVFVDNLPPESVDKKANVSKEIVQNLVATFRHLRHKKQLLIIPLTMYSGFEQASFNAEWSKSFISCSLGIWKVGLVTLAYGVVNATMSLTGGQIVKYTGRRPLFLLGMAVDLCIQFTMIFWIPDADHEYVVYIISAMWGLTDGVWQTQINTLYGCLFSQESEAAFSNYRMWESLGFIIAFAYSNYLCTSVKVYILTSVLVVGMIGYFIVEWIDGHEHRTTAPSNDNKVGQPELTVFRQKSTAALDGIDNGTFTNSSTTQLQ